MSHAPTDEQTAHLVRGQLAPNLQLFVSRPLRSNFVVRDGSPHFDSIWKNS